MKQAATVARIPAASEVPDYVRHQKLKAWVAEIAQQLAAGGIQRKTVAPPSVPARGEAEDGPSPEEAGGATSLDPSNDGSPGPALVLLAEGRELDRVAKDRFLIGRGKHCDLIINSGKVSREHAAITREGQAWFIEDLGSSNGTWFDAACCNTVGASVRSAPRSWAARSGNSWTSGRARRSRRRSRWRRWASRSRSAWSPTCGAGASSTQ